MKKVAIIAPNSLPVPPVRGGGVQTAIFESTKHYKNYKPYVFSICEPGIDKLPLFETVGNIEHHRISLTAWEEFKINLRHLSRLSYFPYVQAISKKLLEIKPDIINVYNRPWFLPILRKYLGEAVKIISYHHNNYFSEMSKDKVKSYLSQMDAFAAVSRFTAKVEVINRFPEMRDRCFVVYNGINLDKFRPKWECRKKVKALRGSFGIKEDEIVLMFAGRLRKEKGIHTLIKATREIVKKNDKVKLIIVGSHFYGAATQKTKFISDLIKAAEPIKDNVIFAGFIPPDRMPSFYIMSDIFAVPSHTDAFGLTYAEAEASGLPVIGTKRGGIPEVVEDGKTGYLIDNPENIELLIEKIEYFIENAFERERFGKAGRKRVEEKFTWDSSAKLTEEMYDKVLGA